MPHFGGRRRLAAAKESRPGEVKPFVRGRDAYSQRLAHVSANEAGPARLDRLDSPVGYLDCPIETQQLGLRHAFPRKPSHDSDQTSPEPVPPRLDRDRS